MTRKANNAQPPAQSLQTNNGPIPFRNGRPAASEPSVNMSAGSSTQTTARTSSNVTTTTSSSSPPSDPPRLTQEPLQAFPRFTHPFTRNDGCISCWLDAEDMHNLNCIHRRK
ncbi:hypothetical protein ACHAQH_006722 [Verticillium albo-atrum]